MRIEPVQSLAPAGTALPPNEVCEALARRLRAETRGEVHVRRGVARPLCHRCLDLPDTAGGRAGAAGPNEDIATAIAIARELKVPVLARGGGTSQCGQTTGAALVIDNSKHFRRVLEVDVAARTATVEPGLVLDHLNAQLKPHGLWYPVDVSTSAQATLGGMAGNNSCGSPLDRLRQHGAQRAGRERLAVGRRAGRIRAGIDPRRARRATLRSTCASSPCSTAARSTRAGPR